MVRHTMATLMLENGADVRYIREMLGHADLQSTQIYKQVSIRQLKKIHEATHPGASLEKKKLASTSVAAPEEESRKANLVAVLDAEVEEESEQNDVGCAGDRRQLLSCGVREGSRSSRPRRITSELSDAPCAAPCVPHCRPKQEELRCIIQLWPKM